MSEIEGSTEGVNLESWGRSARHYESKVSTRERRRNCESSTFTAVIHAVRSSSESFLHSRRTLGLVHVPFAGAPAKAEETKMERRRRRVRPRKEAMMSSGRTVRKDRAGCMPFIRFVDRMTSTSVSAARGKQALSPRVLFGFWTAGSKNQDTSRIVTDGNVCTLHTTSVGRNDHGTHFKRPCRSRNGRTRS